jgi:hypothetical protein
VIRVLAGDCRDVLAQHVRKEVLTRESRSGTTVLGVKGVSAQYQWIVARVKNADNPAIRYRWRFPNYDHGHLPQAQTVATWNG